jgi:hypothetical protein
VTVALSSSLIVLASVTLVLPPEILLPAPLVPLIILGLVATSSLTASAHLLNWLKQCVRKVHLYI